MSKRLVTLEADCKHAPAQGGASVMHDGNVVGTVTSGQWGHRVGKNLAYAFVTPDFSAPGSAMTIDILGDCVPATVIDPGPYDPSSKRMKA